MEIRNLQTFICVAQTKSFTKTAEQLNYAQSTVTVQIQQLEQELGVPLFDRIGKTVSLTAYGSEFLSDATQILSMVEKATSLNKNPKQISGVLRIGALESLLLFSVLKVIPKFKEEYPLLDIKIEMGHSTELIHKLKENSLDMIFILGEENSDPDLKSFYVNKQELIFVCGKDHPFGNEKNITTEKLFSQDFVLTENSGFCNSTLKKMAKDNGFVIKDKIEADSIFAVIELVKANMGLAFLPECAVESHIKNGDIKKVDVEFKNQIHNSQILCHKNRWISPFITGFINEIKNN
ncbi:MAG: LysR family transcriptional regulator [Ruminococcaceae bacterium]|nr:LysR family transcriptional regulator [Oscillospiraceae bacterium]